MIHILIYVIFFAQTASSLIPIILHTPIFSNNKLLNIHHSVGLYKNKQDNIYKHMYVVDFSPNIPIDNPQNIGKLLLGNHVNGKIRICYFDTMNHDYLLDNFNHIVNISTNRIIITEKLGWEGHGPRVKCNNYGEKSSESCEDSDFYYDIPIQELHMILESTNDWDLDFQLYNHNCQHFSKYFIRRIENNLFMD